MFQMFNMDCQLGAGNEFRSLAHSLQILGVLMTSTVWVASEHHRARQNPKISWTHIYHSPFFFPRPSPTLS